MLPSKRPTTTKSLSKPLSFPNKTKLCNLLRTPLKPPSPIKDPPPPQSNPNIKPLKSNSISYSNPYPNGSSILIFGSNPSIIQINNYLPNKSPNAKTNQKAQIKSTKGFPKSSNNIDSQDHRRTHTTDYDVSEKEAVNMPFSARNEGPNYVNKVVGILDHKASLPLLGWEPGKSIEKFGINLKALINMKKNPKFNKFNCSNNNKNPNFQVAQSQSPVKVKNLSSRGDDPVNQVAKTDKITEKQKELKERISKTCTGNFREKSIENKNKTTEEAPKNLKDMMGGLLQRATRVLQIYSLKEKKWKIEREALKREISQLKNQNHLN